MPVICDRKGCDSPAVLKRPKSGHALCKECFFFAFELEIHITIENTKLFKRGDRVAIGASGGKDSTVLAYIMKLLNERYDYGLDLFLLSIDEGIAGYRDDSLETVKQNRDDYQLPLKILSYKDLYGWTMDEIVQQIGDKNNCTFCGTFRRQALDRGAALVGANMIVTGHNADDMAETVIMNILRGDIARLSRCTNIITQGEGTIPRCKPLKYVYEKEIVMYAHFKKLVYFSTECKYAPNAYRGYAREYIKQIERVRPSCLIDIIYSGENLELNESVKLPERQTCTRCGFVASQEICKACVLLEGLNTGNPKLGIGKSNKAKRALGLKINDGSENKPKSRPEKGISKKKIRREEKRKKTGCGGGGCSSSCGSEQIPDSELKIDMEKEAFLERNCPGGCKLRTITLEKELLDHLPQSTRAQLNSIKKNFNAEVNSAAIRDCKTSDDEQTESSCEEDKLSLLSRIASNMEPAWYCTCKNGESSSSRKQYTRKKNSVAINKLQKPELFIPTSKSQTENACSLSNDHSVPSTSAEEEKIFDNDTKNEENITCRCPEILRIHPNHPEVKVPYNKSERLYDIEDGEDFDIHVFKSIMIAKHPEIVDELKKLEEEQLKNNVCTEEPSSSIAVIKQNQTKTDLKDDEKISQLSSKLKTSINLESQNQSDNDNTNKIEEQLTNTEINDTNGPQLPKSLKNIEQSSDNQPTIIKATPKRKEPSLIRPEMMHKAKNNLDF